MATTVYAFARGDKVRVAGWDKGSPKHIQGMQGTVGNRGRKRVEVWLEDGTARRIYPWCLEVVS